MGIKKELFVSDISVFLCVGCDEVALNPVLASCCEAVFCSDCFNDMIAKSGHVCRGCSGVTTAMKLQKLLKTAYLGLELICDGCDELMKIEDRDGHNCPAGQIKCDNCRFEGQVPKGENHDCVDYLKNRVAELVLTNEDGQRRLKQLEDDGDQFKAMFEQFMRKNGIIQIDKDGTVHVQINGADNLGRFRPRNVKVSTKPFEVIFNDDETEADKEIRDKVSEAVLQVANSGINIYVHLIKVKMALTEKLGGQWYIFPKENYNQNGHGEIVPSSYCSFTFDGHSYIAFKTEKAKRQRTGNRRRRSKGQNGIPVELSDQENLITTTSGRIGMVFRNAETEANEDVREKVVAVILDAAKSGVDVFANVIKVREAIREQLKGWWYLFPKKAFNPDAINPSNIITDSYCSFNFDGRDYIAFIGRKTRRGGYRERLKKLSKLDTTMDDYSDVNGDVSFNKKETFATSDVKEKIVKAIFSFDGRGVMQDDDQETVQNIIRDTIGGQWYILKRSKLGRAIFTYRMVPTSFCSFSHGGEKYIAFEADKIYKRSKGRK